MDFNEYINQYEPYEPSDEELREIEETLKHEDEHIELRNNNIKHKIKNRVFYEYKSEDMWRGWLKIHGIRW